MRCLQSFISKSVSGPDQHCDRVAHDARACGNLAKTLVFQGLDDADGLKRMLGLFVLSRKDSSLGRADAVRTSSPHSP